MSLVLAQACSSEEGKKQAKAPPPVPVKTASAKTEDVVYYDAFPGTISPVDEVEVRPQLAGYITAVHFEEGSAVRRGQRLYTIDTRQYAATLQSATADVSAAEANLALAEKDVARYTRLAEAEAIATQTLDQASATAQARRQALESAYARVAQSRTQLDYASVRAPISGLTGIVPAKIGTQVSPGMPVLTTISQVTPVGVDFALPQELIPRLARAEANTTSVPDSMFRMRLPNDSLYANYGTVYALDRAVDPATGTLTARLRFDNSEGVLRVGMNVEIEVLNDNSGKHVTIPVAALAEQMGERYVFVKHDSLALRQQVKTGQRFRDKIIVTEGLKGGEEVLVTGLNRVRDSTKVRLAGAPNGRESSTPPTAMK